MKKALCVILLLLLLTGCASRQEAAPSEPETQPPTQVTQATQPKETEPPVTQVIQEVEQEAEAMAEAPPPPVSIVLEPEASGIRTDSCEVAEVDHSHSEDGYIMVRYFGETESRLKVLLKGPTTTYNYNLPQGQWTVFPLSDGDGSYQVGIYRNTSGTKYATVMTAQLEVTLRDEFAPFLRPNQYVDYVDAPATMDLAAILCDGLEQPLEKVAAVYDYVIDNLSYDHERAATVKSGYLPRLDEVLEAKKGICFDYAALMTAMLRGQGVPCKLVVGYAGSTYHAWISVWTEEDGWIDGAIFFDGHVWKRMDPTFASSGAGNAEIMDFIEHGTYTVKYLY